MQDSTSLNVLEYISRNYYDLTASEKKIADYIVNNAVDVQQAGISELADACGTAEATISRFSRKLGYPNFSAMKIAIAHAVPSKSNDADMLSGKILMNDSFEDLCRKIQSADINVISQTFELIRSQAYLDTVELLLKAERVLCMGQGGSSIIAMEAAHLFSTVSGKFSCVQDGHLQAIAVSNLRKDDVVIYFSYSGSVRDMMDTIPLASQRGAKVVLVTRFPKSPGAELADVILQCGSNESPLQLGSVPARISQLFMLDILFSEYCRRDYETCRESRERIASALADKHID